MKLLESFCVDLIANLGNVFPSLAFLFHFKSSDKQHSISEHKLITRMCE